MENQTSDYFFDWVERSLLQRRSRSGVPVFPWHPVSPITTMRPASNSIPFEEISEFCQDGPGILRVMINKLHYFTVKVAIVL
jgi:hypothetical protein